MPRLITGSRARRSILIVDDNDDTRELLALHFDDLGYRVETAADGNDAIARALAAPPDVIVLDLMMPQLDGFDTAWLLRSYSSTSAIPVIACTGLRSGEAAARARSAGCRVILKKPFLLEHLARVVSTLIEGDARDFGAG